jgi:hypothetical protein
MNDEGEPTLKADDGGPAAAEVRSDGEERGLIPLISASVVAGGFAGLLGSLFRLLLVRAEGCRGAVLVWSHRAPTWGWLVPVLGVAAAGGLRAHAGAPFRTRCSWERHSSN